MLAVDGKVNESVAGSDSPGKVESRTLTFEEAMLGVSEAVPYNVVGARGWRVLCLFVRKKYSNRLERSKMLR